MNNTLSICIPTYNRSDKLNLSLQILLPLAKKYSFRVVISDNNSEDDTEEIVGFYLKNNPALSYFRNDYNIGADANFERALKLSKSKFSWLLGDDDIICEKHLSCILNIIIEHEPNLLIVNTKNQVSDYYRSQLYTDKEKLLTNLGWHTTFISSLIFKNDFLNELDFFRFIDSSFIHFASIFDTLAFKKNINVFYYSPVSVITIKTDLGYPSWYPHFLEVFSESWVNTVMSLPCSYPYSTKVKTARALWKKSRITTLPSFLLLRSLGFINLKELMKYKESLFLLSKRKLVYLFFVCLLPQFTFHPIKFVYKIYAKKRLDQTTKIKGDLCE